MGSSPTVRIELTQNQIQDMKEHEEAMLRLERYETELRKLKDKKKRPSILTDIVFNEWDDPERGHARR